ncbi:MAG: hypothetical protein V1881_03135 [Candidatus Micrarchaeota archaeon]
MKRPKTLIGKKRTLRARAMRLLGEHPEAVDEYFGGELNPQERELVSKTYDDLVKRLEWAGLLNNKEELVARKAEILGTVRRFRVQDALDEKNPIERYRFLLGTLGKQGGWGGFHTKKGEILLSRSDTLRSILLHEFIHTLQADGYLRIGYDSKNVEPVASMLEKLYLAELQSGGSYRGVTGIAVGMVRNGHLIMKSLKDGVRDPNIPSCVWTSSKNKTAYNNNHAEGSGDALHILESAAAVGSDFREIWARAGAFLGAKYLGETNAHPEDRAYLAERKRDFAAAINFYGEALRSAPKWDRQRLKEKIAEMKEKAE